MKLTSLQQKRYDNIIQDLGRNIAFFDLDGTMWLFDNDSCENNFIYNHEGKHITMPTFSKKLKAYVTQ